MVPVLESRSGLLADDEGGYDRAARVLEETLDAFRGIGIEAQGRIGANDPLQAADDGLRQFPADEIAFATHPQGRMKWLEEGVVARAESRYEQPVVHVVVS